MTDLPHISPLDQARIRAQGAKSSVVATLGFMVAGVLVANLVFRLLGVVS